MQTVDATFDDSDPTKEYLTLEVPKTLVKKVMFLF